MSAMSRRAHAARSVVLGAGALLLASCATPPEQTGIRIGDATLEQFKAGVTTEAWLLAVLGPPTSESKVEGVQNTRVLRYALGQAVSGLGALLSGEASKNTAVVYFIVSEGIVTRFWADRATEYTMTGQPVEQRSGEKQN